MRKIEEKEESKGTGIGLTEKKGKQCKEQLFWNICSRGDESGDRTQSREGEEERGVSPDEGWAGGNNALPYYPRGKGCRNYRGCSRT